MSAKFRSLNFRISRFFSGNRGRARGPEFARFAKRLPPQTPAPPGQLGSPNFGPRFRPKPPDPRGDGDVEEGAPQIVYRRCRLLPKSRNPNFRNSPNFPEKIANPPVVWRSAALCAYRPRNLGAGWPIWNPKFRAPLAENRPKRATATSEDTAPRRSAGRKALHHDVGTPTLKRMSPKPGFPEFLGKRGAANPKSEFPDFPISFRETRKSARRPEIGRFLGSPL